MERIIDKRCSGKTKKLFMKAKENHGVVVCHNPDAFTSKALSYGIIGIDFISYNDFIKSNFGATKSPVYIDELENFTKYLVNNFQGYSMSLED